MELSTIGNYRVEKSGLRTNLGWSYSFYEFNEGSNAYVYCGKSWSRGNAEKALEEFLGNLDG